MYPGCERSLIGKSNTGDNHYHGKDGLGESPDTTPPDVSNVQKKHAVSFLIEIVNRFPGKSYSQKTINFNKSSF